MQMRPARIGPALAVAAAVLGGCARAPAAPAPTGDPDPGGRVLTVLRSVERAVPAHAQILGQHEHEPTWDSCDARPGTFGWNDVSVSTDFRAGGAPLAVVMAADRVLSTAGWRRVAVSRDPLGPVGRWSRPVPGGAEAAATLAVATRGDSEAPYWELSALAPPQGRRAGGC